MIHETLDNKTEPLITPEAVYGKHEKICDVCVITFSYKVIEWALQHLNCGQVAEIDAVMEIARFILRSGKGKRLRFI